MSARTYALPGSGSDFVSVEVKRGRLYELRTTAAVRVHPGSGAPLAVDLVVSENFPLVFRADVDWFTVATASSAAAVVSLREEEA